MNIVRSSSSKRVAPRSGLQVHVAWSTCKRLLIINCYFRAFALQVLVPAAPYPRVEKNGLGETRPSQSTCERFHWPDVVLSAGKSEIRFIRSVRLLDRCLLPVPSDQPTDVFGSVSVLRNWVSWTSSTFLVISPIVDKACRWGSGCSCPPYSRKILFRNTHSARSFYYLFKEFYIDVLQDLLWTSHILVR